MNPSQQLPDDPARRRFLVAGAITVGFSLLPGLPALAAETAKGPKLPGSLGTTPMLDAWIRLDDTGRLTVFTGKAELGTGVRTAFIQIAAEELDVAPEAVHLITADTGLTPNEGYTAGSHSLADSGTAILNAAAQVRALLVQSAAARLGVDVETVKVSNGVVVAADGRRLSYGQAVAGLDLHRPAQAVSPLKDPRTHTVLGQPLQRVDIPGKVTGGASYVQDMRLPGMVHARVVRQPSYGARLIKADIDGVRAMPGVVAVVRDGNYLAVVAQDEWQAITAMRALSSSAQWEESAVLPAPGTIHDVLKKLPSREIRVADQAGPAAPAAQTLKARYTKPYLTHGSIGPSCAVAQFENGTMTVWTHTQGVFPLRGGLAEMLSLPPANVRCIHVEGSGCYGHNGADDVAADAALIARAVPGRPVRVQWMRDQEHTWEPSGPAMITEVQASLDATGHIVDWQYEIWSNSHNQRIENAGRLMPTWALAQPFIPAPPKPIPMPEGGGDRNSIPLYAFPNTKVLHHFIPDMPLRVSAMRSLGAYLNVFAIESFMDELALAAKADPVEFRLRHLQDPRGRDVIELAARQFGWDPRRKREPGRGMGFSFAQYKNLMAYLAIAMDLSVDRDTGEVHIHRAVAAIDCGQIVNPDGVRNQVEGGIIQSASWTLYEQVRFDTRRITSFDWSTYPILRFSSVPEHIEVHLIDRPGMPFLGAGEASQGPASAAVANALADATGMRLRDTPLGGPRLRDVPTV
ncbi:xanthine dehydrogenase family protein molybdopterin-binding subunit [Bordetella flabilis]|uniref:Aldehyde dehydrogenase n=1 Tax=Bordetella flabilis TaxID=463014 RepID=A0A193GBM0_9BORD|nr:molybdopterin cofactor-binding domain-containing protein [Bordetella flabilis]ANN76856.1 aldehyde dehydrogenase [Bordetella flabilis]